MKPAFVVISDIHFSLTNLELSDRALNAAINKAAELDVPLIDCGDLTNDKAIIRGEVMNRLIETFARAKRCGVSIFSLVGNHSLLNEKASEHGLNFLTPYAKVIDSPMFVNGCLFMSYQSDVDQFKSIYTNHIGYAHGKMIFMHQGVIGANMGDYISDKSAIPLNLFPEGVKVFSGHYHRHQTVGPVTYVGNPFTMSFGEAHDGPKGYLIVNDDGSFEQVPFNFRKHVVIDINANYITRDIFKGVHKEDLVWLKTTGAPDELSKIDRYKILDMVECQNLKIDKIELDTPKLTVETRTLTGEEILDSLIDNELTTDENKAYLKYLWREVLS